MTQVFTISKEKRKGHFQSAFFLIF